MVMTRIAAAARWAAAALLATALAAVQPAQAEPLDETRAVIELQLDAFQRDAWDEAYGYAAPGVRSVYPNVESFAQMVQSGYPMVWRPQDVLFVGAYELDGRIVHRLRLIGPDGRAYVATYVLEPSDAGWLIAAVMIEEAPGVA